MHKRIIYKYNTGKLSTAKYATSKHKYRIKGKDYIVFVDLVRYKFQLLDKNGEVFYEGGNTKSKNKRILFNQIKAFLVKSGCKFLTEVRMT